MPGSREGEFGSDRIRQRNEQGLTLVMATRQAEGSSAMLHLCSELHTVPQFPTSAIWEPLHRIQRAEDVRVLQHI